MRLAGDEQRREEEGGGGVGPLGRRASPLFLPSRALTVSNTETMELGTMPTLRFSLKVDVGRREESDGHPPPPLRCLSVFQRADATIVIWDGSQKRQGSCIFNCSEEQSLITIIEHSGSLQTHLALLIWEHESTKHKFLFCRLRQEAFFFFFFF